MNPAALLGGFKQYQAPGPYDMQNDRNAARLGQLKVQGEEQDAADQQAIRGALKASGGQLDDATFAKIAMANPRAAQALAKSAHDATTAQYQATEAGLKAEREKIAIQNAKTERVAKQFGAITDEATKKIVIDGMDLPPDQKARYAAMPFDSPEFQATLKSGITQAQDALTQSKIAETKLDIAGKEAKAKFDEWNSGHLQRMGKFGEKKAENDAAAGEIDPATGLTKYQTVQAENAKVDNARQQAQAVEAERHNRQQEAHARNMETRIAQATTAGLTKDQNSRVMQIANQFDNEPIVKNFNIQEEGLRFVKSLGDGKTANAGDDQALLYAFAKAMDPGSVVREGEYATVQKYSQSWADNFGFKAERVFSNSPFLTNQARSNMRETITKKVDAAKASYENLYKEYGRRIEKQAGVAGGVEFLPSYGVSQPDNKGGGQSSAKPKVGQEEDGYIFLGGDPADPKKWKKK